MATKGQAIGGSAIQVRWNGEIVGWCTRADYTNPSQLVSVESLGDEYPNEIAHTGHSAVSMSLGMVRIYNRGLYAMGLTPRPGDELDAISFPAGTLSLYHRAHDKTIVKVEGARVQSEGGSIDARGVMMQNCTLMGTRFKDETTA